MTIWGWFVLGSWLAFLGYWVVSAVGAKKNIRPRWPGARFQVGFRVAVVVVMISLLRIPGFGRRCRSMGRHGVLPGLAGGMVGATLCVMGVGLAIWARAHLGGNWGRPMSIKEDPELVTTGPYARLRHPIYAGLWLALLGSAIGQSAWWLVPLVLGSPYLFYSARVEERTMLKRFPEAYGAYIRRTKMFIPFLF